MVVKRVMVMVYSVMFGADIHLEISGDGLSLTALIRTQLTNANTNNSYAR